MKQVTILEQDDLDKLVGGQSLEVFTEDGNSIEMRFESGANDEDDELKCDICGTKTTGAGKLFKTPGSVLIHKRFVHKGGKNGKH